MWPMGEGIATLSLIGKSGKGVTLSSFEESQHLMITSAVAEGKSDKKMTIVVKMW